MPQWRLCAPKSKFVTRTISIARRDVPWEPDQEARALRTQGDHLLALKGNQSSLQAVHVAFDRARNSSSAARWPQRWRMDTGSSGGDPRPGRAARRVEGRARSGRGRPRAPGERGQEREHRSLLHHESALRREEVGVSRTGCTGLDVSFGEDANRTRTRTPGPIWASSGLAKNPEANAESTQPCRASYRRSIARRSMHSLTAGERVVNSN
jgi:hypothetical protein